MGRPRAGAGSELGVIGELLRAFVHALVMRELQARLPGQHIVDALLTEGGGLIVTWWER